MADSNKQPGLTIVTVVLNAADALEKTIKSVISQTQKIEYIVIDGGSTDETLSVIKKYQKYLAYWQSEPDKGIYDAMNKGIKKASGVYVNFLNAGDTLFSDDVCDTFINSLKTDSIYIYLMRIKRNDGKVVLPRWPALIRYYKLPTYHQGIIYPGELLKKTPYPLDCGMVGDFCHYFQLTKFTSVRPIVLLWCNYDITGVSSVNKKNLHNEFARVYKELGIPYVLSIVRILRGKLGF